MQTKYKSEMFFHIANALVSAVLHHCMTGEAEKYPVSLSAERRRMEKLPKVWCCTPPLSQLCAPASPFVSKQ